MIRTIKPAELRLLYLTRQEVALLDLREEELFALGHPLFASQLSAGRIEIEILDRVPRKDTCIVLYDNDEGLVESSAVRMQKLGYQDVTILEGGLAGWQNAGYQLFRDVNSYSKAFGELVESRRHTPSLPAPEVDAMIQGNSDIAILDARRFDEYQTMNIPTSISVPGGELVMRAATVAPSRETTIIVNCAGRTRSIIGAQSLINAGIPNRIFALRNGTIGWVLAGQKLEHGQDRRMPGISDAASHQAAALAREVAYRAGVRRLTVEDLDRIAADPTRTLYKFDVRTPEEYFAGHLAGFRHCPGGQLVQETDIVAPVRGARIILADNHASRADMSASWLAQMGWEVYVLDEGLGADLITGPGSILLPPRPVVPFIGIEELADMLHSKTAILIDLARSPQHRTGHIPGARFALRSDLPALLPEWADIRIVLTSPDGALAEFAAADLPGEYHIAVVEGGTAAWSAAGRPLEPGIEQPLSAPSDVYRRPYEGTDNDAVAMQAYLDWEYGLVDQLTLDGTHGFFVI